MSSPKVITLSIFFYSIFSLTTCIWCHPTDIVSSLQYDINEVLQSWKSCGNLGYTCSLLQLWSILTISILIIHSDYIYKYKSNFERSKMIQRNGQHFVLQYWYFHHRNLLNHGKNNNVSTNEFLWLSFACNQYVCKHLCFTIHRKYNRWETNLIQANY